MSPILLRPIREQMEHDRVIRQLQARWRRRYDVAVNVGAQEENSVRAGGQLVFPDVILTNVDGVRRLHAVVEVETAESVNHLEAMAQWAHMAKARGAFYLYVPAGLADVAGRLCQGNGINVSEIWTYYAIGEQVRFSMSYRSPRARQASKAAKSKPSKKVKTSKKTTKKTSKKKAGKPAKKAKAKSAKRPAKKAAAKRVATKKTRPARKAKKKR